MTDDKNLHVRSQDKCLSEKKKNPKTELKLVYTLTLCMYTHPLPWLFNSSSTYTNIMVFMRQKRQCKEKREWRRIDYCYWMIGYVCTTWWLLSFLYHSLTGFDAPESPGVKLNREGVAALHPVVLVPGIVTGGLELWEGRPCAEGLFRKPLWGGSFAQFLKRCDF